MCLASSSIGGADAVTLPLTTDGLAVAALAGDESAVGLLGSGSMMLLVLFCSCVINAILRVWMKPRADYEFNYKPH